MDVVLARVVSGGGFAVAGLTEQVFEEGGVGVGGFTADLTGAGADDEVGAAGTVEVGVTEGVDGGVDLVDVVGAEAVVGETVREAMREAMREAIREGDAEAETETETDRLEGDSLVLEGLVGDGLMVGLAIGSDVCALEASLGGGVMAVDGGSSRREQDKSRRTGEVGRERSEGLGRTTKSL